MVCIADVFAIRLLSIFPFTSDPRFTPTVDNFVRSMNLPTGGLRITITINVLIAVSMLLSAHTFLFTLFSIS